MQIEINNTVVEVLELGTDINGLKYKPQMVKYDNDADWASFTKSCSLEVSVNNFNLVKTISKNYMTSGVIEIGVSRNGDRSFTNALLSNKPNHIKYLGIDLEDKTYLNNSQNNIYTIKENSFNQDIIRNYIKQIGIDKISILFIDGWHSVNACINDWLYTDLLSESSIVFFHDTNYHPGPRVFIDCIDPEMFRVEKHFLNEDDYGLAVAYKL